MTNLKREKTFNTIEQLFKYIEKSNLKAVGREGDKVKLHNNDTNVYKETVTVNF